MKVLIDECLPVELRLHFPDCDCVTVQYLRANGLKDGALLKRAVADRIDVLITIDGNMQYQQNLRKYPGLAIIFLSAHTNTIEDLIPLVGEIRGKLKNIAAGQRIHVPVK